MRITIAALGMALMVGCASAEMEAASGADTGVMLETSTGGTGGAGAATGGSGGSAGTGGAGGAGGSQGSPDAQPATKMDAQPAPADSQPAAPQACMSNHEIVSSVCMDPPNSSTSKVLRKDGRACNICATYKSDGRTVEKQFVGCIPAAGAICVMTCDECK